MFVSEQNNGWLFPPPSYASIILILKCCGDDGFCIICHSCIYTPAAIDGISWVLIYVISQATLCILSLSLKRWQCIPAFLIIRQEHLQVTVDLVRSCGCWNDCSVVWWCELLMHHADT